MIDQQMDRRNFMRIVGKSAGTVAACCLGAVSAMNGRADEETRKGRPNIVAIYYPHWHNYDHGSAWKGEGWTEWEGVKAAIPRFSGHQQPKKPVWGYFDESDPAWADREISLAADHGIDVFLYCWYWYSGVRNMEEALEKGFLQAPNRNRMKFALMWANHDRRDQFCPEFGKPRNVWLPSRHSPHDLERMIDYCIEHYFRQPTYWRVNGELFFSVFEAMKFVEQLGGPHETSALLKKIDTRLHQVNLPSIHWNAMLSDPKAVETVKQAGFQSTSRYNVNTANKAQPDFTEKYEDVMEAHRVHWGKMSASSLVNLPVVTMGWDVTPRCRRDIPWPFPRREYPYVPVVVGNTPELYEQLLRGAARHIESDTRKPFAVVLNAWNEWTEGGYLLPEERTGTGYLAAIKRTFGGSDRQ
ncbi:MAG: glycoside hydrolase family 99-like domain-containing protein [Kiritimatiellae bacterium]|nr:glycoside hydrolase family 99-like domain-containing protein [Kiritimatiellia bacterium]MDD5521048.1 glycoside hydrolase family 99-like domain-containing protein [Kiritimatiellia bacterium]